MLLITEVYLILGSVLNMIPLQGEATFAINPDGVGDARDWEDFFLPPETFVRKFTQLVCSLAQSSLLYILTDNWLE